MPTNPDMSDENLQILDPLSSGDASILGEAAFDTSIPEDALSALQMDWDNSEDLSEGGIVDGRPFPAPKPSTPQFPPTALQACGPSVTLESWACSLNVGTTLPTVYDTLYPYVEEYRYLPEVVNTYLYSRLSFDDRRDFKFGLSTSQRLFVSLTRAIRATNGDVTNFCAMRGTIWNLWMRKRAVALLSQVMYSSVQFPGLPAEGLGAINCISGLPAQNNVRVSRTSEGEVQLSVQSSGVDVLSSGVSSYSFCLEVDPEIELTALTTRFVEDGSQFNTEFKFIPVALIYRFFFLDKALPYYAYLYWVDMQGKSSSLNVEEQNFLSQYSYYDFVACITFLGSLLLTAAKSFSQMLYEGVQLMLVRAYCSLGILQWAGETGMDLQDTAFHKFFTREFSPGDRMNLSDCPGDAYAQQGWEIFKRRSSALGFLSELTSRALFGEVYSGVNTASHLLGRLYKILQEKVPTCGTSSLNQAALHLESFSSLYFDQGIIAIPSRGYLWVASNKDDLPSSIRRVCDYAKKLKKVYYTEYADVQSGEPQSLREWFFLSDLLLLDMTESLIAEIMGERKRREEHVVSIYGKQDRNFSTVSIPKPVDFGIKIYKPDVTHYKNSLISINVLKYLKMRMTTAYNPNLITIFPILVIRDMKNDASVVCLKLLQDMRTGGLGLFEARAREKDLTAQIYRLQDLVTGSNSAQPEMREARATLVRLTDSRNSLQQVIRGTLELFCRYLTEGFKDFMYTGTLKKYLQPEVDQSDLTGFILSERSSIVTEHWTENLLFDYAAFRDTVGLIRDFDLKVFEPVEKSFSTPLKIKETLRKEILGVGRKSGGELKPQGRRPKSRSELKPQGRRPKPLFFALKRKGIDAYVLAIVVYIRDEAFVGFSDGISILLEDIQKDNTAFVGSPRRLVGYEYKVFPLKDLVQFIPCSNMLSKYIDIVELKEIRVILARELPTGVSFRRFIDQDFCPTWLQELHGVSTPSRAIFGLPQLPEDVKEEISYAHGLEQLSVKEWNKREVDVQKRQIKVVKAQKKNVLRYLCDPLGRVRKRAFSPNYTYAEDVEIITRYRAGMSEEQRIALQASCQNRPWGSIRTRARILANKLLDEGEFDLNKIPVRYITANYYKKGEENIAKAIREGRLETESQLLGLSGLYDKYLTLNSARSVRRPAKVIAAKKDLSLLDSKEIVRDLEKILDSIDD